MTYLISGATGSIGRQIVNQLVANGADVHALSRKPEQAKLPAGVKLFQGDLTTGALQTEAFADVKRAFLFPAEGDIRPFLRQAKAAGVEHIVALSSLAVAAEYPRDLNSASYIHHLAVEQAVKESGLAYTFLRPGSFANNLRFWSHAIKTMRMVFGPYPQSAQVLIHEADVAAVAVAALTQPGHRGATYALTGPECLTQLEQLKTIEDAIGQELTYQVITPEQYQESVSAYMPADIIKMLLQYWCETVDQPEVVRPTVEQITGRPAYSLARWAKEHVSDFM
jgi:uncharacterized protein YbjT (DUF2867 family)